MSTQQDIKHVDEGEVILASVEKEGQDKQTIAYGPGITTAEATVHVSSFIQQQGTTLNSEQIVFVEEVIETVNKHTSGGGKVKIGWPEYGIGLELEKCKYEQIIKNKRIIRYRKN